MSCRKLLPLALTLTLTWMAGSALAEPGKDALLTRQQGEVEIRRQGSNTWTPVIASRYLTNGDSGQTGSAARAQVQLQFRNLLLAVGPTTRFTVAELNRKAGQASLELGWGALRARLRGKVQASENYQVLTPNAVLAAQGTEWVTHYVTLPQDGTPPQGGDALPEGWPPTPPGHTRVAVHEGTVRVQSVPTGAVQLLQPRSTADIGPEGMIVVNPPDFPYPVEASAAPAIERGTTGRGELQGEGGKPLGNPSQPSARPTIPSGSSPHPEPPHP
jgi:hypothetical protein